MKPELALFTGQLVRLAALNPDSDAEIEARWSHNSEYQRLQDSDPVRPFSSRKAREWMGEETKHNQFNFSIRTLADDRLIGDIGLSITEWVDAEATVGIGLGDPEYWGKGYGTDAMRVILRYAFTELNLHRVTLNVFEYNPRAIRCYEKVGFTVEGRVLQWLNREGRRWDLIYMGILREEWERINRSAP